MRSHSLGAGVLLSVGMALGVSACGGVPTDAGSETSGTGSVSIPLTATSGDTTYRLADAKFTINGSGVSRVITPPADLHVHQETLPTGKYEITLEDGWRLEKKSSADRDYSEVPATLSSQNPIRFEVKRNAVLDVVFTFVTAGGKVDLSRGRVNVRIDVQDCQSFDTYSSSIAEAVVDCTGTIGPNSFALDDRGFLRRNFGECRDRERQEELLSIIDGFVGLQYVLEVERDFPQFVTDRLAYSYECITERWAAWKDAFDRSGVVECPTWRFVGEQGTPTLELYKVITSQLPKLPFAEREGNRPDVINNLKISRLYDVVFENGTPDQQCGSPGDCAQICAAGFPGFVLRQDGETVLTDPPPWQRATVYGETDNPYAAPYYHAMSLFGAVPGQTISHYNRSKENEEFCSYYDGEFHVQTLLKPNCAKMPDGTESCVGLCAP